MWYWPTYAIWAVRRNHVAFVWSTTYIWMRRVTFRRNDNDQFKVDLWSLFHHECGELLLLSVSKSNLITSSGIPKSPLNVLLVRLYATDSTSLTLCPWHFSPDSMPLTQRPWSSVVFSLRIVHASASDTSSYPPSAETSPPTKFGLVPDEFI